METKYIAYYRVSTAKQGQSGLGLEAQRSQVQRFVNCQECIIAEFTDIESGKSDNRPELLKALEAAKQNGATLVIAKLDRLSRNLTFISTLMDSHIKFVCCDMPQANEFTIHIFAALAQQERKLISERTKAALKAKKEQGLQLGKPENLTNEARAKGVQAIKEKAAANQNNSRAKELISVYKEKGLSWSKIAEKLNNAGFKTAKGGTFQAVQVQRLYK